jgi:cell division protein YceG involved in septum cleavage
MTSKRALAILVFALTAMSMLTVFLTKTKEYVFDAVQTKQEVIEVANEEEDFPLGVDPIREVIVENPEVDAYFTSHISAQMKRTPREGWFNHTLALLAQFSWYQNLASPISRILVIDSGERKEEIADHFAKILRWDAHEQSAFTSLVAGSSPELPDGKFFPGHYVVNKDATPQEVAALLNDQFNTQVLSRYPEEVASVVPIEDALTIASLLEREAYDFEDMRFIAGVIWNRLFIDMNLQLDASLQYANADNGASIWWPVVRPADKFIDSPFNTYKNVGLPPSPIANPSTEAILAALNPKKTDCLFYFHDSEGGFHCTQTYDEHVTLLRQFYGTGQ